MVRRWMIVGLGGWFSITVPGCGDGPSGEDTGASTSSGDAGQETSTTPGDGDGDPSSTSGDGDGDGDPSTTSGDGDGDPSTTGDGDGDGEPGPCAPNDPAVPGMTVVWCDDFSGPEIDPLKWEFEVNGNGGGNNELQYYTDRPENARIENGALVIEAREETYTGPDGTRNFTSARLRTVNKGDWTYGRFEMRGKLPLGKGLWPAFWMLPTDWVYGGWAASGEIDIVELIGQEPDTVYGTLHYGGPWPENTSSAGGTAWGTHDYVLSGATFNDDFHVFAIEWEPGEFRWYVDGIHYQTQTDWYSTAASYPAPFDQAFHFIANVAVGGNWPGSPNGTTQFPQQFQIDWVRVLQ